MKKHDEEQQLRSVALQNANSILVARQRAEHDLIQAKESLERKTQELARSLALMRATLESSTDGILAIDKNFGVTNFNAKFVEMWGISAEVIEARQQIQLAEVISPQLKDPQQFIARVTEIYRSAPPESFDVLELADGRVFERFSKTQVVEGESVGRVWIFRDITERRRAEEALKDETRILELLNVTGSMISSQLDLQSLVQAVTDAATQLSGSKFGAFFYTTTDEGGDALLLYTLSGAPREAFEKFGHPRATALFGPTFRGDKPIRCDDVLSDPRYGKMKPHNGMPQGHLPVRSYLAVPVISRSGEVIGGLFFGHPEPGIFAERTERLIVGVAAQAAVAIDNARLYDVAQKSSQEREVLLARERTARAEAERMSEMKDEFLATLSHELRTPLNAILGWAQILQRGARDKADMQKGLETIERNVRVQTSLIEDLLDMSRITSGKVRLDIEPIDPVSFVESALETIAPAAAAKGIRLEKLLRSVGLISGDPNRLQQIMWNLLSNAIKFTPPGGTVRVSLRPADSEIEFAVSDTGAGISREFLPYVFDRFRQADASTTRSFGGLGLGLSIVRNLVELHGGTVQVDSLGKDLGSTFTVRLPRAAAYTPAFKEALQLVAKDDNAMNFRTVDLSGLKILVVDDEADARTMLQRLLTECRAEVSTAGSAKEAMSALSNSLPDVLVSDIGMPETDGYQLIRKVQASNFLKGKPLPAIALTAFARSDDQTKALRAGFLRHMSKPVDPFALATAIAEIAKRKDAES